MLFRSLTMAASGVLLRAVTRPWETRPGALAAAVMPPGPVPTELVSRWLAPLFGDRWPTDPMWICAVGLVDGRRVVFGQDGAPAAEVADAVGASCAIPGYFSPVEIGGVRYVDGGAHSPTNADVLAGAGLDLVVVSSPMSAARPLRPVALDLAGRRLARVTLAAEAAAVRRRGTPVLAFQPTPEDRAVMGAGVGAMDPSRRGPVTRQAHASTLRRLRRPDLAERLAVLADCR